MASMIGSPMLTASKLPPQRLPRSDDSTTHLHTLPHTGIPCGAAQIPVVRVGTSSVDGRRLGRNPGDVSRLLGLLPSSLYGCTISSGGLPGSVGVLQNSKGAWT